MSKTTIDGNGFQARAARRRATYTIRRHTDPAQMKVDEYRYWRSQPTAARMAAVSELTTEFYAMKGKNVPRLQRSLVRIERS